MVLCLVIFFCFTFFKSHAPKWATLVPTLIHLDHRISYFWIQGSIVNSENCLSCSSVLVIHSKRMPRKAHFSFVLVFLLRLFRWSSLNQCFLQCQAFVLMLLSWGLGIICRKSIGSAQKKHVSLSRSARSFLFHKEWLTLRSVRGIHFSLLVMKRAWSYWMPLLFNNSQMFISDVSLIFKGSKLYKHNFNF